MPEGIVIEFTDPNDFEEVKLFLHYFSEKRLPLGTPYEVIYDPDAAAFYGKVKALEVVIKTGVYHSPTWEMVSRQTHGDFMPDRGVYLVKRGVTTGQVPPPPENGLERLRTWADDVSAVYGEREEVIRANEEA